MADVFSKKKRSSVMRAIKSADTKPEIKVRREFRRLGYYSAHKSLKLPGKPDVVLKGAKLVVFVHGCFWHQHRNCKIARMPKSNKSFWRDKFRANLSRDRRVKRMLKKLGWKVGVIWECQTRSVSTEDVLREKLFGLLGD